MIKFKTQFRKSKQGNIHFAFLGISFNKNQFMIIVLGIVVIINLNQSNMKQISIIMILAWSAIFALFISKLSEQKKVVPAEEHKFTFVNAQDWARDTTLAPGKTLTLDRIYEQGK